MKRMLIAIAAIGLAIGLQSHTPFGTCPPDWPDAVFLRDIDDCHYYYLCNYGVPNLYQCPAPLEWDVSTENCVFPWQNSTHYLCN